MSEQVAVTTNTCISISANQQKLLDKHVEALWDWRDAYHRMEDAERGWREARDRRDEYEKNYAEQWSSGADPSREQTTSREELDRLRQEEERLYQEWQDRIAEWEVTRTALKEAWHNALEGGLTTDILRESHSYPRPPSESTPKSKPKPKLSILAAIAAIAAIAVLAIAASVALSLRAVEMPKQTPRSEPATARCWEKDGKLVCEAAESFTPPTPHPADRGTFPAEQAPVAGGLGGDPEQPTVPNFGSEAASSAGGGFQMPETPGLDADGLTG